MSTKILPVIMCGGAGTRVWPESRETLPKQFIALIGDALDLPEDGACASTGPMFERADRHHQSRLPLPRRRSSCDEIGAQADIVLEPVRRDSGPAVAVAAELAAQRGAGDRRRRIRRRPCRARQPDAFVDVCAQGGRGAAARGYIVTLGVKPTEPATGYGYIRPGAPIVDDGAASARSRLSSRSPTARPPSAMSTSGYLWNSGNFFFRADMMQAEIAGIRAGDRRAPPPRRSPARTTDLDFLALDARRLRRTRRRSRSTMR